MYSVRRTVTSYRYLPVLQMATSCHDAMPSRIWNGVLPFSLTHNREPRSLWVYQLVVARVVWIVVDTLDVVDRVMYYRRGSRKRTKRQRYFMAKHEDLHEKSINTLLQPV